MRRGPIFWPLLLIAAGVIFLLSNFGLLPPIMWETVWRYWPVILIVIGLDILWGWTRRRQALAVEPLSLDLGGLTEADVRLEFGAGQLRVDAGAAPGKLLEGEFGGGVNYRLDGNRLRLRMPPFDFWAWQRYERGHRWDMKLTRDIPLRLRVQTGASQTEMDLTDLCVTDLRVEAGAAETTVRLPRAAGYTRVHIESGAASTRLVVPEGVAARINSSIALGTLRINPRFVRSGAEYVSGDYATAANKIEMKVEGGVGEISIE